MEKDKNNHYDIKLENNYLYKKYEEDYSVIRAVDEFVRFFIYLDDYILGLE